MDFVLSIKTDEDAETLLADSSFIASWKALADPDPKTTALQEPPFVLPWYRTYAGAYRPVLCLAHTPEERLVGFMPLARESRTGSLTHAGASQCEYSGWLSHPEIDQDFPVAALVAIKRAFPMTVWEWRWSPPGANMGWLSSRTLAKEGIYTRFLTQASPVWDLADEATLQRVFRNKARKNLLNRYKARGDFRLERITDPGRAEALIGILKDQCDFRQYAAHHAPPFGSDPRKEPLCVARMADPATNHFVTLWSAGKPVAMHLGVCDRDTVYNGISGFDPTEARNSPGTLLLAELGQLLKTEGFRYFDLTPGGDAYKETFANKHEMCGRPIFYFGAAGLRVKVKEDIHDQAVRLGKRLVRGVGADPKEARAALGRLKAALAAPARRLAQGGLAGLAKSIREGRSWTVYRLAREDFRPADRQQEISVQQYTDLLRYEESGSFPAKPEFLAAALRRFAEGDQLYSLLRHGVLAHAAWVARGGKKHRLEGRDLVYASPRDSVVLYGFYTHPRYSTDGFLRCSVDRILTDSFSSGAEEAFVVTAEGAPLPGSELEQAGFIPVQMTVSRKLFGIRVGPQTGGLVLEPKAPVEAGA